MGTACSSVARTFRSCGRFWALPTATAMLINEFLISSGSNDERPAGAPSARARVVTCCVVLCCVVLCYVVLLGDLREGGVI